VFRGQYAHAIDEKGRTSLPSRFREILAAQGESRLVLTMGIDPCLAAYPMKEWLAFEERLAKLPRFDPSVAMIRRLYVSSAIEIELDKVGRVLVPQTLRERAGLDKGEALWAGMGPHLELWSKERFDALRSAVLADESQKQAIAQRLAELGL
jgi:MraZ protein